jgi:transcriptional regulator with GAF, ATPase, and Fis domain
MAMQSIVPPEAHSLLSLQISLGEPPSHLATTGYVAWADALGRAGVRFSELPDEARVRLRIWLTEHASTPSCKAPRWVLRDSTAHNPAAAACSSALALSLETQSDRVASTRTSTTVQYEFKSLGQDLTGALRLIASRACAITRGTGAAVALSSRNVMSCRAVAGKTVPEIGAVVDTGRGLSGECLRQVRALRCDDAETDPRADWTACRQLGVRSVVAAPIVYERDIVGLLEVFSPDASAFDEGDVAVVERLARTVLLTLSHADAFRSEYGNRD